MTTNSQPHHLRMAGDPAMATSLVGVERSITIAHAALEMGADESTVRKLLKEEELRGYRLGKRGVRVYVSSIQEYQQRQRLGGASAAQKAPRPRRCAPTPAHREAVATLAALGIMRPPTSR